MHQNDRKIGIIKGIESIRTGSFLKKKDSGDTRPNWYEYQDIRFYVKTKSNNIESWYISKVLPLTSNRFYKLGGKEIE